MYDGREQGIKIIELYFENLTRRRTVSLIVVVIFNLYCKIFIVPICFVSLV